MRAVIDDFPQSQFFLDGQGTSQHGLWTTIKRFELQRNINLVPAALEHSEVLIGAHLLIHPQPQGRCRAMTLGAMSRGLPVLAHDDPWVDHLIEDKNVWLVHGPDPVQWEGLIRRVIEQPDRAEQLGRRARRWVSEHGLASNQITQILDLYRRLSGKSLKFPAQPAADGSGK